MKKDYAIFNMRLAGRLMADGFVLRGMKKRDKEGSRLNVFFFKETDELLKKIEEFKLNK